MSRLRRTASSDSNVSFPPPYSSDNDEPTRPLSNHGPIPPTRRELFHTLLNASTPPPSYPYSDEQIIRRTSEEIDRDLLLAYTSHAAVSRDSLEGDGDDGQTIGSPLTPSTSGIHHPRVAVLFGVKNHWHKWLFFCRLLSVAPELKYGIPLLWNILQAARHLSAIEGTPWYVLYASESLADMDKSFLLVELLLAALWCAVSGYLSFFCTDCLMTRWLLYYTPLATLVRLITVSSINYVITSAVLERPQIRGDSHLLLPGWLFISTASLILYLYVHGRTTIKRKNDRSGVVFATAGFVSTCVLVAFITVQRYLIYN